MHLSILKIYLKNQNAFKLKNPDIFTMNKFVEIILGLILLVIAIYVWGVNLWGFGSAALSFLKGGIIWIVILVGAVLVFLGISELKD